MRFDDVKGFDKHTFPRSSALDTSAEVQCLSHCELRHVLPDNRFHLSRNTFSVQTTLHTGMDPIDASRNILNDR